MQNRLIVSMCKSFCDPKEKLVAPTSTSTAAPPGLLSDSHHKFNEFLEKAKEQAKSLKSKIRGGGGGTSKHNKFKKISHSISNLSELLEAEEDEMIRQDRLQKLKFPLALPIDVLQLEADKEEVEKGLNKLIHFSKNSRSALKRSTSDPELSSTAGDMSKDDSSPLSPDFDFKRLLKHFEHRELPPPRPLSSPYYRSNRERRGKEMIGDATLSAAFKDLEMELATSDHNKPDSPGFSPIKISPKVSRRELKKDEVQTTPTMEPKSKDEAMAELDDIIDQIKLAADEIQDMKPFGIKQQNYKEERNKVADIENRPSVSPLPTIKRGGMKSHYDHVITGSIETNDSCSSSETRRKTFSGLSPLHSQTKRGHRRVGSTGSTLSMGSSSSSSNPHPLTESLLNFPMDSEPGEPGAKSLHVLCLLSQNPECIQPLISHICLSDFKDRLVGAASGDSSSVSTVSNIANLVYNIFEVREGERERERGV